MSNIKFYEISEEYVNYLSPHEPRLFRNRRVGQNNTRKYIGVILKVNDKDYFAQLSSFKPKHRHMKDGLDFIKIRDYAVINLNCMLPVPRKEQSYLDFGKVTDEKYKSLLFAEYRVIKTIQDRIKRNAETLYRYKINNGDNTPLAQRCNDFKLLEELCEKYRPEED